MNVSIDRAGRASEIGKCEQMKETRDAMDNYFDIPRGDKPFLCTQCGDAKLYSYKCDCCKKTICDDCVVRIIELLCGECVNSDDN